MIMSRFLIYPTVLLYIYLLCLYPKYMAEMRWNNSIAQHVKMFEKIYKISVHVPIYVSPLPELHENYLFNGVCMPFQKRIILNKKFIQESGQDSFALQQLIFHELGHCVLNLDHNDDIMNNNCPKSIMHSRFFGDTECYWNNIEYYLKELNGQY